MTGQTPLVDHQVDRNRLSLARNAVMLADQDQVLRDSREVVRAHNRRVFGADYMPGEDDDTNIHIGDITHQPSVSGAPVKSGLSPLVGGLIGAGLLAAGGPLALLAWNAVTSQKTPAPVVIPAATNPTVDTDTKYEIRLLP